MLEYSMPKFNAASGYLAYLISTGVWAVGARVLYRTIY
jgi:hypothetical protein